MVTETDIERAAIAILAADHPEASGWSGKTPAVKERYRRLARAALSIERDGGAQSDRVEVSTETLFAVLDVIRLAPVYALLHVAPDEIADDFKPHKWEGFEREFAQDSVVAYRRLLAEMGEAMGVPVREVGD